MNNRVKLYPINFNQQGQIAKRRRIAILKIYSLIFISSHIIFLIYSSYILKVFLYGLMLPGGGFLLCSGTESLVGLASLGLFILTLTIFIIAIILWFATGNIILPITVWLSADLLACAWTNYKVVLIAQSYVEGFENFISISIILLSLAFYFCSSYKKKIGRLKKVQLNNYLEEIRFEQNSNRNNQFDELSLESLQLMRLLLDRALQPIDEFNGFEWIDQFQTSAVRYQINFLSYGLSFAKNKYLTACEAYLKTAQENLRAKQENRLMWNYWLLENIWGNFRFSSDPISRENIMYAGFVAAQLAYDKNSSFLNKDYSLTLEKNNGTKIYYQFSEIIEVLVRQYRVAPYGLLCCEPNWIYPLCNFISLSAIKAFDSSEGTEYWSEIKDKIETSIENEFINTKGYITPFFSSKLGLGMSSVGGAMMQGFPCLFLNSLYPAIAHRQWSVVKKDKKKKCWSKVLWPVDVGNYGYSRASSYSTMACTAVEIGDNNAAAELFELLETDCPSRVKKGIMYRPNASLWAHTNEFMARCNEQNGLRNLVNNNTNESYRSPYIKKARYPEVLIAKAKYINEQMVIVLYPGEEEGVQRIELAGLKPSRSYILRTDKSNFQEEVIANYMGELSIDIYLQNRTYLELEMRR